MPDPPRVRKRSMPKFNAIEQAQRFLNAYVAVCVVFNFGRQLVSAENYQNFRLAVFASWGKAVAISAVIERSFAWLLDLIYQYSPIWYLVQMCVISVPRRWSPRSISERARFDSPICLLLAVPIALICVRYLAGY